jgi:hypothetical protein
MNALFFFGQAELRAHVNNLLVRAGGNAAPGHPISSCKLYPEKNYAFVEFRTVEEASNCMAFDGCHFRDNSYMRVRPHTASPISCMAVNDRMFTDNACLQVRPVMALPIMHGIRCSRIQGQNVPAGKAQYGPAKIMHGV